MTKNIAKQLWESPTSPYMCQNTQNMSKSNIYFQNFIEGSVKSGNALYYIWMSTPWGQRLCGEKELLGCKQEIQHCWDKVMFLEKPGHGFVTSIWYVE